MHDFWRSSGWHLCERTAEGQPRPGDELLRGWRWVAHFLGAAVDETCLARIASRT
jgi:hypothetical protein